MGQQIKNNSINYIEFPMRNPGGTRHFYERVFGWGFTEWGPTYLSFTGAAVEGGFNMDGDVTVRAPGVLVVLYAEDLEKILQKILDVGGRIIKPIYEFPGGKRFHFADPNGNELAIWSDK